MWSGKSPSHMWRGRIASDSALVPGGIHMLTVAHLCLTGFRLWYGCMWWIHLSTPGSFGAGYALDSLSQSSQRDLFIHARSDPHMAKFRLSSELNMYIFGLWGQPSCPERPHTDQTGPGQVTCMKWPLGFCKQPYLRILPSLCLQHWIAALLLK